MKDKQRIKELEEELRVANKDFKLVQARSREYLLETIVANNHAGKLGRIIHRQRLAMKKMRDTLAVYEDAADQRADEKDGAKMEVDLSTLKSRTAKHVAIGKDSA